MLSGKYFAILENSDIDMPSAKKMGIILDIARLLVATESKISIGAENRITGQYYYRSLTRKKSYAMPIYIESLVFISS